MRWTGFDWVFADGRLISSLVFVVDVDGVDRSLMTDVVSLSRRCRWSFSRQLLVCVTTIPVGYVGMLLCWVDGVDGPWTAGVARWVVTLTLIRVCRDRSLVLPLSSMRLDRQCLPLPRCYKLCRQTFSLQQHHNNTTNRWQNYTVRVRDRIDWVFDDVSMWP